jgi:hypothetical protein
VTAVTDRVVGQASAGSASRKKTRKGRGSSGAWLQWPPHRRVAAGQSKMKRAWMWIWSGPITVRRGGGWRKADDG